mgnify:FL=1
MLDALGSDIIIKETKEFDNLLSKNKMSKDNAPLFNIVAENAKNGKYSHSFQPLSCWVENFTLKVDENPIHEYNKNSSLFLIVRSLKNDDGTQKVPSILILFLTVI